MHVNYSTDLRLLLGHPVYPCQGVVKMFFWMKPKHIGTHYDLCMLRDSVSILE